MYYFDRVLVLSVREGDLGYFGRYLLEFGLGLRHGGRMLGWDVLGTDELWVLDIEV